MTKFLSILFLSSALISTNSFAQSVSDNAESLFTDKVKEKTEELVEGIKDTVSETDNAIEKTVDELGKNLSNETALEEVTPEEPTKIETTTEISENPMENTLVLTIKSGQIVIQLKPEIAPNHTARIKELAREGFYDGIVFHRVIDGFMAQTGDPTGTGKGGSGKNLEAEFNDEKHIRGTLSMARAADPNSADSQFFIMFDDAPHLDGNYTAFGQITSGLDLIDGIKKGYGPNGMVNDPDSIITLKVAADIPAEDLPDALKKSEVENKDEATAANDNSAKTETESPTKKTN